MRQFVSPRFWLTIAVLVGLTFGLWYVLVRRDASVAVIGKPVHAVVTDHRINLLQPVYSISAVPGFAMVDGLAGGEMRLALDASRTMVVKPGTPGQITCSKLAEINQCIVAADLLGDAVVWFSLIPNPQKASLVLPGITAVHKDNWVLLANGWEVARSEVVERNCDATGLTDFVRLYGGSQSTSTYSYEQQEITKVTCLVQPEIPTTTTPPTSTTLVPPVLVPVDTAVVPEEGAPPGGVPPDTAAPPVPSATG
ncbi:MAG: hypothetical protein QOC57_1947 [Ilumatobacteraceae bacterium]